jgi:transcriptional regulator with XRE-family HTH domain
MIAMAAAFGVVLMPYVAVRETGMEFKDWIAQEMSLRDLSQSEMARRSHGAFGQSAVNIWVKGRSIPDPDSCAAIAEVFGIGVDTVLWHAGHRQIKETLSADDPLRIICDKALRVRWDTERLALVGGILDQMVALQEKMSRKQRPE